jgi:hypothetical protein
LRAHSATAAREARRTMTAMREIMAGILLSF